MRKKIKLGPNPKIIFHWIMILTLILLLSFVFKENPKVIGIIIFLLFSSLLLNKTTYASLDLISLNYRENLFLFIKKKKETFKTKNIEKVVIKDKGASITVTDLIIYEYLFFVFALLSGGFFYDRRYELTIIEKDNKQTTLKCNIPKSDVKRIGKIITSELKLKYEYIENIKN